MISLIVSVGAFAISIVRRGSAEIWLLRILVAILVYLPWARGGTSIRSQLPLPWVGFGLLGLIFLLPAIYRGTASVGQSLTKSAKGLLRDPVVYTGGLFLILLAVQWWNAGRYQFFNPIHRAWEYTAPGIAWLPFAFLRAEAKEMLVWFCPAWAMLLAIRNPGISPAGLRTLWTWMAANGGVLALLGLAQCATGAPGVLWTQRIPGSIFFSTFGYANHAGAFFTLMFCLSGGLCIRKLYSRSSRRWGPGHSLLLAFAVLNLAGTTFSLSRVGIILAWTAVIILVVYTIALGWRRMAPAHRLNLVAALVGAVCLIFFVIAGLPGHSVFTELSTLKYLKTEAALLENPRTRLMQTAVEIWMASPWFGVGGWGFAHLFSTYLPGWKNPGLANVHNDPLQFLVEFGAVGTLLLCATLLAMSWPLLRTKRISKHPLATCAVLGLSLTLAHSLVDLPFRCPAILFSWLAILAGIGVLGRTYRLETISKRPADRQHGSGGRWNARHHTSWRQKAASIKQQITQELTDRHRADYWRITHSRPIGRRLIGCRL